jgi:hypothetical protein
MFNWQPCSAAMRHYGNIKARHVLLKTGTCMVASAHWVVSRRSCPHPRLCTCPLPVSHQASPFDMLQCSVSNPFINQAAFQYFSFLRHVARLPFHAPGRLSASLFPHPNSMLRVTTCMQLLASNSPPLIYTLLFKLWVHV